MADVNQAVRSIALPLPQSGIEAIRVQVKINGQWQTYDSATALSPAPSLHERRQQLPAPARREEPAMTMGRDPDRFLFTFGKFKGQYIGDICATEEGRTELYDWCEFFGKEMARATRGAREPVHPGIEVAHAMAEAHLLEIQFVPKEKYKTPRRVK